MLVSKTKNQWSAAVYRPYTSPYQWVLVVILLPLLFCLSSCSKENKLRTDIAPIAKRLPMVSNIIAVEWVSERIPKDESRLTPPTLDVRYVLTGTMTVSGQTYSNLLGRFPNQSGQTNGQLLQTFNAQIQPNILKKFVFLPDNKISFELECR